MPTEDVEECPWCDMDIPIKLGISTLGDIITCPHCGKECEVEGDYASEDSWYFVLKIYEP